MSKETKLENLELVVASVSKEIYLTAMESDYEMDVDNRIEFTKQVMTAMHEWHTQQERDGDPKKGTAMNIVGGSTSYLFHTTDDTKAKKIKRILEAD